MDKVNIVTSFCIDDPQSKFFQLSPNIREEKAMQKGLSRWEEQRNIYWGCVMLFFLTSTRVNKTQNHLLYTNDEQDIFLHNKNIKEELVKLGVEIIYLPFTKYDSQHRSHNFRLAYYKFEVLEALSKLDSPSMLLDSDCVWLHHKPSLFSQILSKRDSLFVYNHGGFARRPHTPYLYQKIRDYYIQNNVQKKLADDFNRIGLGTHHFDSAIWYGGEFVAAHPHVFKKLSENLYVLFEHSKAEYDKGNTQKVFNHISLFEHDELMSSYVYATQQFDLQQVYPRYIKRVWTVWDFYNYRHKDFKKSVWHLPGEKANGLKLLFEKIIDPQSEFWKLSNMQAAYFIGKTVHAPYYSVPKRIFRYYKKLYIDIKFDIITSNGMKKLVEIKHNLLGKK